VERDVYRRKLFSCLVTGAAGGLCALALGAGQARGEMAEELLELATAGDAGHLYPLNPAHLRPKGAQAGALLLDHTRTTVLDHGSTGGEKITSDVKDDYEAGAALVDLGAGAGIELSHTIDFHSVTTALDGRRNVSDKAEVAKIQHSEARLVVELTNELKAAIDVRFLHKDMTVYGEPFLRDGQTTHYVESLTGYGAGFAYDGKGFGLGWTLFPPLRGSTQVVGQQMIVIEPGLVSIDGWLKPQANLTVGVVGTEYFHDRDDLAAGSTAPDNTTTISLYGLDPDQYVLPEQLVMLGADYELSKQTVGRLSVAQETDKLDFADYAQYGAIGVRQDGPLGTTTQRLKGGFRFLNQGVQVDIGLSYFQRSLGLPASMNGGSYKASGKELYAAAGLRI
jgi:hypothetical protein